MCRRLFKLFCFGAVLLVGAAVVLGPKHMVLGLKHVGSELKGLGQELRDEIRVEIDRRHPPCAENQDAELSTRLAALEKEFATRIGAIEAQRDAVQVELDKLAEDTRLCKQVIALCDADQEKLAEDAELATAQKALRLEEITAVQTRYEARLAEDQRQIAALSEEIELLTRGSQSLRSDADKVAVERERMDRELAALQRNEELVGLLGIGSEANLDERMASLASEIETLRSEQRQAYEEARQQRLHRQYEARAALERLAESLSPQ